MVADPVLARATERHGEALGQAIAGVVRVHLYLRVSSPDQDLDVGPDGRPVRMKRSKDDRERDVKRSLDTQEQEGRVYVTRCPGWAVEAVYREIYTSQAFWERPELARLRDAVVAGRVDVMLCLKTERLGGNSNEVGALEHLLARFGARLEFVQHQFEDTPIGRIGKTVMVEFNSLRIESLKEQFSRNKRARLDAGRTLHGPKTPYGTVWADEAHTHYRFRPPEDLEWQVLRSAFLDVIAGRGQSAVASALTRRRVPAPMGGAVWYQRSLSLLLRNPLYGAQPKGLRYHNDVEQRNGRRVRRQVVTPEGAGPELRVPEGQPPVTPEEFAAAQAALDANAERQAAHRGTRRSPRSDWHLLGGYAVCGRCGGELRAHYARWGKPDPETGKRRRTPRYDCKANRYGVRLCDHPVSIGREALEREVFADLMGVLNRPGEVDRLLRDYREAGGVSEADRLRAGAEREAIRVTLEALDRESRNLGEQIAVTPGGYARDVLVGLLEEKGRHRDGLLADLRSAEDRLAAVDEVLANLRGFSAQAQQVYALLQERQARPRLFRQAVLLFRPKATVHPANRAEPDKPWLGTGPRVEVGFPPAVPEAVRALLAAVALSGGDVRASGNDEVWSFPLVPTPAPPAVYLAVAPSGRLRLVSALPAGGPAAGPLPERLRA